jgi:hypothetical protein
MLLLASEFSFQHLKLGFKAGDFGLLVFAHVVLSETMITYSMLSVKFLPDLESNVAAGRTYIIQECSAAPWKPTVSSAFPHGRVRQASPSPGWNPSPEEKQKKTPLIWRFFVLLPDLDSNQD